MTPPLAARANPVLVVGGGIGGLAAALALSQQGYSVQVFEQAAHRLVKSALASSWGRMPFRPSMRWASAHWPAPALSTSTSW